MRAGAAPAQAAEPCRTTTVTVEAGASTTLRLDCRIGKRVVAEVAPRRVTARPKPGSLSRLTANRFRYTARGTAAGTDTLGYRLVRKDGRRHTGTVRIRITGQPQPQPLPQPDSQPQPGTPDEPEPPNGDGLPAPLPAVPGSVAATTRNWTPTVYDTCPKAWTDPYGGNASPEPFRGAVCQLVAPTETAPRAPARTRVFGRNVDPRRRRGARTELVLDSPAP